MGTGGKPAAQAQQTNTGSGGFDMNNFMQQLLPHLFGGQQGQGQQPQPAGFGSVAMPQVPTPPPLPFQQQPAPGIPNLMRSFLQGSQQLAQQHATPFPPPPIRPTPGSQETPNAGGSATQEGHQRKPGLGERTRARREGR